MIERYQRRPDLATVGARTLIALLLASQFACISVRGRETRELRNATGHYAQLVRAMDHAGIAALFTPNGELVADNNTPIRSPAQIEAFLRSFSEYRVVSETLSTDTVHIAGDTGRVIGIYRQRVRVPAGDTVAVSGSYIADWLRDSSGIWRIRRMATKSKR